MGFVLSFKSSVMSASLPALSGDLWTGGSSISVCPIGMQTPVASNERRGAGQQKYVGFLFFTATAVPTLCLSCRSFRYKW
jgi:hypothetical protein